MAQTNIKLGHATHRGVSDSSGMVNRFEGFNPAVIHPNVQYGRLAGGTKGLRRGQVVALVGFDGHTNDDQVAHVVTSTGRMVSGVSMEKIDLYEFPCRLRRDFGPFKAGEYLVCFDEQDRNGYFMLYNVQGTSAKVPVAYLV